MSLMNWIRRGRSVFQVLLIMAVLAGASLSAQTFTTLYNFTNGGDGSYASFGGPSMVRDSSGNLYGTTYGGGGSGYGTLYKRDTSGHVTVLHSFSGSDGIYPNAGLVRDAAGNLYGTTQLGGSSSCGTVYKVDVSGNFTVLHDFQGPTSWCIVVAGLVMDSAGNLYGTTYYGGSSNWGSVFKIDSSGNETEIHSFAANGVDGISPVGTMTIDSSGNLYGTTGYGGVYGWGTVFKIDANGTESILHSFRPNGTDGIIPQGTPFRDSAGNIYGTTLEGGQFNNGSVYKLDSSGNETVVHSFNLNGGDGGYPFAGVVQDSYGNLYGATDSGGASGYGTVFKLDGSGNETVLHSFTNGSDGGYPDADLIRDPSGNLYGTTDGGGTDYGTIYEITFSVPFSAFTAKLQVTAGPPPGFQLSAAFTQGTGAPVIDPTTQTLTLNVGNYSLSMAPGAFTKTKKGSFVYQGTINGVAMQIQIVPTGSNSFQFLMDASGVNPAAGLSNPIPLSLSIGNNTGSIQVNAGS